jgi:nucleotide-binding universal stress UspA family protein
MSKRRRSFESGHRPKYLVIADETPEADRALYFAARRAARTRAALIALAVAPPVETQPWAGVEELMRQEAATKAGERLTRAAERARQIAGIETETVIREGETSDEILKLVDEDEDISALVLAAGTGSEGPGPLVSALARSSAAQFPVPVTIVPGSLTDVEIDALAG